MIPYEEKELAQIAFEAYNEQAGGRTWDDKPIPAWQDVGEKVQANWKAATKALTQLPPLDDRERATLEGCLDYAKKPYGDVGHNLKMLVAKLANGRVENG